MSASGPTNLPAFFNTDAEFRSWAQAFHDALTAAGWVNTSDTGQINLSTVAKPAANNTAQGYEIWRMADAQQATLPCFMKIEYGSGGAVDRPSLWFTTGTAANGSGTLTGNVTARQQIAQQGSKSAGVTLPSYFSGDTDRFSFVSGYDNGATTYTILGCVERTADSSFTATADAVISYYHHSALDQHYILPPVAVGVPSVITAGVFFPMSTTNLLTTIGVNVACVPALAIAGKPFFFRSFASYKNADVAGGSSITLATSAGNRTYTTFSSAGQNCISTTSGSGIGVAMIFQ